MKYIVEMSNENWQAFYKFLKDARLDRAKNRNRWKFLSLFEDVVLDYEDVQQKNMDELGRREPGTPPAESIIKNKEINERMKTLQKQVVAVTFADREIFEEMKIIFLNFTMELEGHMGKMYSQIEDALYSAKQTDVNPAN